ncbi:MAG: dihydrofolate reductase [Candidatus Kerfeldbacteria bacterium]|nr:dihydrofolate reductase [Candidatus Kerfeldbacteria bacterium]
MIAAVDAKRGIGIANKLPWNLKGDLDHFRKLTVGQFDAGRVNSVIMGRTTWDSLPAKFRPLPQRLNIVLTRDPAGFVPAPNVLVAKSLDEALQLAEQYGSGDIFVIGGASVYAQAIVHPACTKLYLTEIQQTFQCDTFFPGIPPAFHETSRSDSHEEGGVKYQFVTYEKA